MTALSASYDAKRQDGEIMSFKIKATYTIYKGALTGILPANGYLYPAANTSTMILAGVAVDKSVAVSGESDGARSVRVFRSGVFQFAASSADQSWVGQIMYVADDNTVAKSDPGNTVVAGVCVEFISSSLVKVDISKGVDTGA